MNSNTFDKEAFFHATGMKLVQFQSLGLKSREEAPAIVALVTAKSGVALSLVRVLCVGLDPNFPWPRSIRAFLLKGLEILLDTLPAPSRPKLFNTLLPRVRFLVDCFPVSRRGPRSSWTKKAGRRNYKFQGVTDMAGRLLEITLVEKSRMSDIYCWQIHGTKIKGIGVGDRGYQGALRLLTPIKKPRYTKKMRARGERRKVLSSLAKKYNKTLQVVRQCVERAFGRIHNKYGVTRFSHFGPTVTLSLVNVVIRVESMFFPPAPTRHLRTDEKLESAPHCTAEEIRADLLFDLAYASEAFDLRCQNSKNRAKSTPLFKPKKPKKQRVEKK